MTARKPITDKMKWQALLYWNDIPCPECGVFLCSTDDIEWDHRQALIHDGEHDCSNIEPLHATCHTQKTIRGVKALAKVKRLEKKRNGEPEKPKRNWPKGRKLQSRPFQKKK